MNVMGFAQSEYAASLHTELLRQTDTSDTALMQGTENTHVSMLSLLQAPGFPVQTWYILARCPVSLPALEARTKRIGLNSSKAH